MINRDKTTLTRATVAILTSERAFLRETLLGLLWERVTLATENMCHLRLNFSFSLIEIKQPLPRYTSATGDGLCYSFIRCTISMCFSFWSIYPRALQFSLPLFCKRQFSTACMWYMTQCVFSSCLSTMKNLKIKHVQRSLVGAINDARINCKDLDRDDSMSSST